MCVAHIKRIDQFSPFGDGVPRLRMVRVKRLFWSSGVVCVTVYNLVQSEAVSP